MKAQRKAVKTQAKGSVLAKKGSESTSERQCLRYTWQVELSMAMNDSPPCSVAHIPGSCPPEAKSKYSKLRSAPFSTRAVFSETIK